MGRVAREPETIQADPTAPRPVDADGRELDGWGLPLNGPARAAAIADDGRPDPLDDPDAWTPPPAVDTPVADTPAQD